MLKVAFVCVHNSNRSQMAEAISKIYAKDTYIALSAGTHLKNEINPEAVSHIKRTFQVDMTETQKPKTLEAIGEVDILVTMGCNVECPYIESMHREDWGLDDPTGKPEAFYDETIQIIKDKVLDLKRRIEENKLK